VLSCDFLFPPFVGCGEFRYAVIDFGSSWLQRRYEERFDGVLLAHDTTLANVEQCEVEDETEVGGKRKADIVKAKILNGLVPYLGLRVHAKLLLFSPQPDMILGKLVYFGRA
jgi:hypothetical protein